MTSIPGMGTHELLALAKKNECIASLIDILSENYQFLIDNNIDFTTAGIQVRVHPLVKDDKQNPAS